MVIALCVVQFWFEIILVISDQTHAACSFDLEIMHMISDQIALHSVLLSLFISLYISLTTNDMWIILLFLLVSLTIYWKRCNNDLFVHTSKLCVLRTDWWWSALPKTYYTTQNYFPYGWIMHFILIHVLVSLHHKGSWFSDFPFLRRR